MDAVYQTAGHSVGSPEQFSLQPSASQGKRLSALIVFRRDTMFIGHLAGGFARHRYDLKTQTQHPIAHISQQIPTDRVGAVVGRGEVTNGVVQQLVHQIQHQPHTSSSSQRASTSMSAHR